MSEQELCLEIIATVEELYEARLITPTGGNVSARIADEPDAFLITPTMLHKGGLRPESIVRVDGAGKPAERRQRPSVETGMHLGDAPGDLCGPARRGGGRPLPRPAVHGSRPGGGPHPTHHRGCRPLCPHANRAVWVSWRPDPDRARGAGVGPQHRRLDGAARGQPGIGPGRCDPHPAGLPLAGPGAGRPAP